MQNQSHSKFFRTADSLRWLSPPPSMRSSLQTSSPGNPYALAPSLFLFFCFVVPLHFVWRQNWTKTQFWWQTGRLQQTLAGFIEKTGKTLHSGNVSTVRLCPEFAGKGRYFEFRSRLIPASIDFAKESPLCTTLFKDGVQIRTVEHLLSALEATGVDNCKIEIHNMVADDQDVEAEVGGLVLLLMF